MMNSSSTNAGKQQARLKTDAGLCSFCQKNPTAVTVQRPLPHRRKKRVAQSLCLLHYYSTSAVREDASPHVSVSDPEQVNSQLPKVQELFAEAFCDLQQKLQAETARAFEAVDPLAVVQDLHSRRATQKGTQPSGGGFISRRTPLPDNKRRLTTQKQQARVQETRRRANDKTQSRKPSRKSIWNTILEEGPRKVKKQIQEDGMDNDLHCTCGSSRVQQLSSLTSRNQDMLKGEIWGTKDRGDDVISRCQCLQCGKIWNQEGV
jgi:hypothetical protein